MLLYRTSLGFQCVQCSPWLVCAIELYGLITFLRI